ncbi:MAG: UPF0182 family protein [Clostridia bacterium]|nr:UPF0182 family protein [Clostridia bacterium]
MKILDLLDKLDKMKTKNYFLTAGIIFLVAIFIVTSFNIVTQVIEIREIGENYTSVYWKNQLVNILTMLFIFVVVYIAAYITNKVTIKNINKFFKDEDREPTKLPNKSIAFFVALLAAFFLKNFLSSNILLYLNTTSFEFKEAVFGKDIGYYMMQRPFLIDLFNFTKGLLLAVIVYTLGYYVVVFGSCFDGIVLTSLQKNHVIKHNLINVVLFFLVMALSYTFTMEDALFGTFLDGLVGAGFTDINIKLVAYKIARYLIIVISVLAYIFIERNKLKRALIALFTVPVFWVVTYILMFIVQVFFVNPSEFGKESNFIQYNMENTRRAYGINNVDEHLFQVTPSLTGTIVDSNFKTVDNIAIVDGETTVKALNQNQATKDYYKFNDADMALYNINGVPTLTYVSAREVDTKGKNYINRTFQFTHGFGVVMNSVNNLDKDGEPEFILSDIKPEMSIGDLKITEPRIYFGENKNNHVIVNASGIDEFDYPDEEESISTRYTGTAGIKMTFLNRFLMSIKNADMRMMVSSYINSDSVLLTNRNVIERAKKVVPFLKYDENPYLVIDNAGKLYWIVDAYTLSAYFPYSEYFEIDSEIEGLVEKYNYIRNSVKVVIDAYNGTTTFYIVDKNDPLIMAYAKAYPSLFVEYSQMPQDIKAHITYSKGLFDIQAKKLQKYHVRDVNKFYKEEDIWNIANYQTGRRTENIESNYSFIKVLDGSNEELVLMVPYTPQGRTNLTSWFMVRNDASHYGKMLVYKFSNEANVLGTMQLDNKIDQDSEIAKVLNSWGNGTKVTRKLELVPIENSILYVEPIYIEAVNENAVPQVKKVIVAYNNSLAIGDSFEDALDQVINNETGIIRIELDEDTNLFETIEQTISTYGLLKEASKTGEWEEFGHQMDELERLLNKLEEQKTELVQ